ncbi:MAG: 16S rRNA (guanine(527)-N(7))-methyltransferase RsmG [Erysipelotrichaceae bacterium]
MEHKFSQKDFAEVLAQKGLTLSEKQLRQFELYMETLIEWNEKMNLTAITQPDEIYEKHFLDCILPSFEVEIQGSLCDVGAGAGFPSIPLKIAYPELQVTIVEPLGKRVTFLTHLCQVLELDDVTLVNARAEDFAKDYREHFDFVSARAVANMPMLAELCIPLVRIGGTFLALKGQNGEEEYRESKKAIALLGCELKQQFVQTLLDGSTRVNFEFTKIKATPKKYPRAFAQIKKAPLKGV